MELWHHQPAGDLGRGSAGPLLSGAAEGPERGPERGPEGALAARLVEARARRSALGAFPGPLPADRAAAYAVQAAAMAMVGRPVAGWKVGIVAEPYRALMGGDRLFGPVFDGCIAEAGDVERFQPQGGFAAVEAELLLRMDGPVAPAAGWTAAGAAARVAEVRCGVELAASPVAGIAALGPLAIVADLGINAGLLLGPSLGAFEPTLLELPAVVAVDGEEQRRGTAAGLPGGPLESLARLLDWLGARGQWLGDGAWVATGAIGGPCPVAAGQVADVSFAETWLVRVLVG